MKTIELEVQGMTCGSCVNHVTKALKLVPGVRRVEVDLAHGRAKVEGDLLSGVQPLIAALASEGYPAHWVSGSGSIHSPNAPQTTQVKKGGCCCG